MKGIVFTEFLELVEDKFGLKVVDEIIESCDLKTDGAYTSVGTYDHKEMFQMVGKLSEIKNIPVSDLLQNYGEFFFSVLSGGYPQFMDKLNLFSFLDSIDGYIHPEVLKLYPDAELPRFTSEIINEKQMQLTYTSSRKMVDFAIGLIKGASQHYKEPVIIEKFDSKEDGKEVSLKLSHLES